MYHRKVHHLCPCTRCANYKGPNKIIEAEERPQIWLEERVPEGYIWAFLAWNESVINRLKEDAKFMKAEAWVARRIGAAPGYPYMIYSDAHDGRFREQTEIESGLKQFAVESKLIRI
jgi:hypothetical protein